MIIALTCGIAVVVIAFILGVRAKDLPAPVPESPFRHLDERKASIYENLRDLQFEYRVGKLSDADYQSTKKDLQKELAGVLAQVDLLKEQLQVQVGQVHAQPARGKSDKQQAGLVCPACGARFEKQLKFCGECGKPMKAMKA